MLSSYRVIDLADDRGMFCGRVLGDLGADVIKVEPPSGDPARRIGPFYKDNPARENSLFWQAYAANKRGITLDLEQDAGRGLLRKLVGTADFLVESFRPGYLAERGLGYDQLREVNPRLIYVSITPFGQDGPYSGYEATDLTGVALSGFMYLTGDEDRAPLRVSAPQFWELGGAAGAAGAMVALAHRATSGRGQHVDVSCQQAMARTLSHAPQFWDMNGTILKRSGPFRPIGTDRRLRVNWECADGYVNFIQPGSTTGGRNMQALCQWMEEEGFPEPMLARTDFAAYGFGQLPEEVLDRMHEVLGRFFKARTKHYLSTNALQRRVLLFPVHDQADVAGYTQLEARGFFREVAMEDGDTLKTLGPWVKSSLKPLRPPHRAPSLGEHNAEVYASLGLGARELADLHAAGVV